MHSAPAGAAGAREGSRARPERATASEHERVSRTVSRGGRAAVGCARLKITEGVGVSTDEDAEVRTGTDRSSLCPRLTIFSTRHSAIAGDTAVICGCVGGDAGGAGGAGVSCLLTCNQGELRRACEMWNSERRSPSLFWLGASPSALRPPLHARSPCCRGRRA